MSFINKMNIGNISYDIQAGEKVQLTFPAGTTNGTLTEEQLAKLQANYQSCIEMVNDKELYYLNDPGHIEGYLTYSHVGIENSKATIKTLTITVSAKSFVIVTTVVPTESGGGGVTSLNGKTGALTLKTVDNQSLIGSGNIPLKTRIYKHYLKYTGADSLEEQQAEAYVAVYSTQSTAYTKSSIAGVFGIGERVVCSTRQAAYGTTGWSDFKCDSLDNTSNDTLQYKANYSMYLELSSDSVLQL